MLLTIRKARPKEAALLSDLAFASKASWGYNTEFMEACREDLTLSEAVIQVGLTFVAEQGERPLGFYRLAETPDGPYLKDLFISTDMMGRGIGKLLWQHATEQARSLGWSYLLLDSDPNAEGFYQALGARRIGEVPSTVFVGRVLPLMRFDLS